jgi:hypothetical protein
MTAENGQIDREKVTDLLTGEPLTRGYRATLPMWALEPDWQPQIYLLRDIELMMTHPMVRNSLSYFKGGIHGAQFEGPENPDDPDGEHLPISDDPDVSAFVHEQCNRFWDRGLVKIQGGYEYGWIATENRYSSEDGVLRWSDCEQFSPRDTYLLTRDRVPVGVRVKSVQDSGTVDLWLASEDVPAKALWYAHEPRYTAYYGQSQLLGAWRPWRRLAWRDGLEMILDMGAYRYAFAGPTLFYPDAELQTAQPGVPGTTNDSQGRPRRWARDIARQMAEQLKAGAGMGFPSGNYPADMGGGPKWRIEWPQHVLDLAPILAHIDHLQKQISYGIGIPPELLEAGEGGSGYSGRVIPLEAFLQRQQHIADSILWLFVHQVLKPLVRWNFGSVKFEVKVRNLLESKRKMQQPDDPEHQHQAPGATQPAEQSPPASGRRPGPNDGATSRMNLPGQKTQPPGSLSPYDAAHQKGSKLSLSPELFNERVWAIAREILKGQAA